MLRPEFVHRKLHLIANDLDRLVRYRDETLESLKEDDVKIAAAERFLERVVMRAIDINEHLISELASGEGATVRLAYKDTFLMLADLGVCSNDFAEKISGSADLRDILVHDSGDDDKETAHISIGSYLADYLQYLACVDAFVDAEDTRSGEEVSPDELTGDEDADRSNR